MARPVIVGIDTGTTSAIAIFDLNKNVLSVTSRKNFAPYQIKEHILRFGKPILIATDRANVPNSISKLAASFGCKVSAPQEDLKVLDKRKITNGLDFDNVHEMDAMSSALYAFKSVNKQFTSIERLIDKEEADKVKEMVVLNRAKNISDAIDRLRPKESKFEAKQDYRVLHEQSSRNVIQLQKKYDVMKLYTDSIEKKLKFLEEQNKRYKEEELKKTNKIKREIMKEKEIRTRDVLIKQMQFELKKQRDLARLYNAQIQRETEFNAIKAAHKIPVIIINDFTNEEVQNAHKEFGIRDQAVFFKSVKESTQTVKMLINLKPKIVLNQLGKDDADALKKAGVKVVDVKPEVHDFYASVPSKDLENAINARERDEFVRWLDDYRKR